MMNEAVYVRLDLIQLWVIMGVCLNILNCIVKARLCCNSRLMAKHPLDRLFGPLTITYYCIVENFGRRKLWQI